MNDFPDFMKSVANHIDSSQQNTPDIDELLIPKGTPHHGRVTKGTRTIHAFGGRRINAVISRR